VALAAAVALLGPLTTTAPAAAFGSSTPPPGPPSVNAGGYMTCGVRADVANPPNHQTATCWGDNVSEGPGQSTPPAGLKFSEVNAGYAHACGIRLDPGTPDNRTVICWGSNNNGATSPPTGMKFSHVAPSFNYTCALRHDPGNPATDKTAVCWGANDVNQVSDVPAGVQFTQLTVGIRHACGLRETPVDDRNIVCWGYNAQGQVSNAPAGVFSSLNSGNFDVCALSPAGVPQCWGRNAGGQATVPPGETFTQVSAGFAHVCGLRADGTVLCWGRNVEGQAVAPLGTFDNVSAGTFHSCAMGTDGTPVCWGNNAAGRVRPEMTSDAPLPTAVTGTPYSHQFESTYMSPVRWTVTSGTLPPGLYLNPGTGLLSGTPTQDGAYPGITVTASNGMVGASETFSIAVAEGAPSTFPLVSIGDVSVHEGAAGTRSAVFTVSLSSPSTSTIAVNYSSADDTAVSPADYQAASGTVSFAPGVTSATVKVPVAGDLVDEGDETFTVALTLAPLTQAGLGDAVGTGTILDDDPGIGRTLAIGHVAVHEGDEGTRVAVFNVSLSKASNYEVTVNFATAKGTALGTDFVARSGTVTFAPGATSRNVKVTITPDTLAEGNESFSVNLSSPAGAVIARAAGTGLIVDND